MLSLTPENVETPDSGKYWIFGFLLSMTARKNDPYKSGNIIITGIGLFLIVGSKFHLFGH